MATVSVEDALKQQLIRIDPEFRVLADEHSHYEERLRELSAIHYPSDQEQLEEMLLKKKKLAVKDQMYAIMREYQQGAYALQ